VERCDAPYPTPNKGEVPPFKIEPQDHRLRAVLAARQMVDLVRLFNVEQVTRRKVEIQIGIGVASGRVVAGYTGTLHRATYTCVGDTVNVAARLEAQTKALSRPILIDENTRAGLGDTVTIEPQGELSLKGKLEPVRVYAVGVDALVVESA
jgi:adenylate cyclase